KLKSKQNRKAARAKQREETRADPYVVRTSTFLNHITPAVPARTRFDLEAIPVASTGFVALPDTDGGDTCGADELVQIHGCTYIPWDGLSNIPITDSEGRIIAVLVARPQQGDWDSVHRHAFNTLKSTRRRCRFPKNSKRHRRGNF
ncbi:hypothetical protein HYPSUDRAFT_117405, partial [Hypholoma sublateritium FD-334 SS-4]